jgi:hypothetical protein
MKTNQELYEKVMHYAHLLEDKLAYDETEEGKRWGKLVNKLQDFILGKGVEEKEIPITYGLIKATCGWSEFAKITNRNVYPIKEFGDYEAKEVFYITENEAKKLLIMKVTIKEVNLYINYWLQNNSVDELQTETIKVLKDLAKFPQGNKYQIRFYFKVLEILITKYE